MGKRGRCVIGHEALRYICTKFQVPLERAGVDISAFEGEWNDMVDYAKHYLDIVHLDYRVIWWRIFNAVDASRWTNVLPVIEPLFSLPLSNGRLEHIFFQLKLTRVEEVLQVTPLISLYASRLKVHLYNSWMQPGQSSSGSMINQEELPEAQEEIRI